MLAYFCGDETCFVATNTFLSRQKLYLWQLPPAIHFSLESVRVWEGMWGCNNLYGYEYGREGKG